MNRRGKLIAVVAGVGVAGGFGIVSGPARWLLANPFADIPVGLAAWLAFTYLKPYRTCRWCRPGGLLGGSLPARLAGHKPKRRRRRGCWRCKGRRDVRRAGAWHVHKARLSLAQAWAEREWLR